LALLFECSLGSLHLLLGELSHTLHGGLVLSGGCIAARFSLDEHVGETLTNILVTNARSSIHFVTHERFHLVHEFTHALAFILHVIDSAAAIGLAFDFLSESPLLTVGLSSKLGANLLTPSELFVALGIKLGFHFGLLCLKLIEEFLNVEGSFPLLAILSTTATFTFSFASAPTTATFTSASYRLVVFAKDASSFYLLVVLVVNIDLFKH